MEKCLFASKFSPWAGVSHSPAIFIINHSNDIFVQLKRGLKPGKADQPGGARERQPGWYQGDETHG